jgi:hypothetical protein
MSELRSFHLDESQRQLALLALAILSLRRPGWDYALGELADTFAGRNLFEEFKRLNSDNTRPEYSDARTDPTKP